MWPDCDDGLNNTKIALGITHLLWRGLIILTTIPHPALLSSLSQIPFSFLMPYPVSRFWWLPSPPGNLKNPVSHLEMFRFPESRPGFSSDHKNSLNQTLMVRYRRVVHRRYALLVKSNWWSIINAAFWLVELLLVAKSAGFENQNNGGRIAFW